MTAPTVPADLTGVDLDLVDETWEDRVCERTAYVSLCGGKAQAVRYVLWSCGCVLAFCVADFDRLTSTPLPIDCGFCPATDISIVRTWPVTR